MSRSVPSDCARRTRAAPRPSARPLALKINPWARASAIALGLIGLGAGGVAVFVTHLKAGPVALITAGLLLLLIGMSGRMPSRLKVGDNEAAWEIEREASQDFVARVAEEITVESRPQVFSALEDLAEKAPQVAAPAISAISYNALVMSLIQTIQQQLLADASTDLSFNIVRSTSDLEPFLDALLVTPTGTTVAVEIRAYSQPVGAQTVNQALGSFLRLKSIDRRARSILLITRHLALARPPELAQALLDPAVRILDVRVRPRVEQIGETSATHG
jgi:hypothetical protein